MTSLVTYCFTGALPGSSRLCDKFPHNCLALSNFQLRLSDGLMISERFKRSKLSLRCSDRSLDGALLLALLVLLGIFFCIPRGYIGLATYPFEERILHVAAVDPEQARRFSVARR